METVVCIILLLPLLNLATCLGPDSEESEDSKNSSLLIRRSASSSKTIPGGNRLSLINSRFNRRPRKKNLDPENLLEILGDFYDPNWMSIDEPSSLYGDDDKGVSYMVRQDAWPYQELARAFRLLNLSSELETIGDEHRMTVKPDLVTVVEKWLMKKASCPVKYAWEDVGNMFWPRWIKRGECASVPGTCSWPPGMHCVETGRSNLHILRWQCRTPKNKGKRRNSKLHLQKDWIKRIEAEPVLLRCQWIRVPYPITSACHCTC